MSQIKKSESFTTVVSVALVLGKVIDHYGLDKSAIAEEVGIDTKIAYGIDDRVSTSKLQKVWGILKKQTGDDCVGLTYARLLQPASLNGLGLAWITSDSLKDAIMRLVRFQRAISTAFSYSIDELTSSYQILVRSKIENPVDISVDASVAILLQLCRLTYGPELGVERVCFVHAEPNCAEQFHEFFGVDVEFGASENVISFSKELFEESLATANPELARMNDYIVINYLKKFDKEDIGLQVRAQIINELNAGVPQQEKIARIMNMSLRNLQRKLKDEGVSYKIILDETRDELSRQYLRGSERSIFEIAYLLGFSDASNFSRAFRRWAGVSPLEYRQSPRLN